MRRIIILIGLLAVSALVIWGAVSLWQKARGPGEEEEPLGVFPTAEEPSPIGGEGVSGLPAETPAGEEEAAGESRRESRRISEGPVAGAVALGSLADLDLRVRFIERQTGHIYDYSILRGEARRLTNQTIPGIQKVHWGPDGERLVLSFLEPETLERRVFASSLEFESATATVPARLDGSFLPKEIYSLAVAPEGGRLFTLSRSGADTAGELRDFGGSRLNKAIALPLTEWLAFWPSSNNLAILSKPSALSSGFLYFLNLNKAGKATDEGALEKILGGGAGLTVSISPDSQRIIYSQTIAGELKTFLYDRKTGENRTFVLNTLPEKCVWSERFKEIVYCAEPQTLAAASYPDDWYQGIVSFSDTIWAVNLDLGDGQALFIPASEAGEQIDAIELRVSRDDEYLFFINKKDAGLWGLKLRAD